MYDNKKMFILGMARSGYEVAKVLAKHNCTILITDMKEQDEEKVNELKQLGINILLNSKVLKINSDGIVYQQDGNEKTLTGFDAIVLAFGSKPNDELYQDIKDLGNVYVIGDALKAGDAKKAIYEATKLALKL